MALKRADCNESTTRFKKFPKTRVIIDCTEYFVQTHQSPEAQSQSWSDYKHRDITERSDRDITERSGFFDKLTLGDDVMADSKLSDF